MCGIALKSINTYTDDGNHLESAIVTFGNVVYYIYDDAGYLSSMSSGDMEVLLDYDVVDNLIQLSQTYDPALSVKFLETDNWSV